MPININQMTSDPKNQGMTVVTYTPKYFGPQLTGKGGSRGVISKLENPKAKREPKHTPSEMRRHRRDHYKNGSVDVRFFPISILPGTAIENALMETPLPATDARVRLAKLPAGAMAKGPSEVWMRAEPFSLCLEEEKTPAATKTTTVRTLTVAYDLRIFVVDTNVAKGDGTDVAVPFMATRGVSSTLSALMGTVAVPDGKAASFVSSITCAPVRVSTHILEALEKKVPGATLYPDDIDAWWDAYSLYDHLAKASEAWQTKVADVVGGLFSSFASRHKARPLSRSEWELATQAIGTTLSDLANYPVPLEDYRTIHDAMVAAFDPSLVSWFSKENLNLLLVNTMGKLAAVKPSLAHIPQTNAPANPSCSPSQKQAVLTKSPLALVVSGAGTGKSSTLRWRLDHMRDCGVDMRQVTVLSFTNAAADHITEIAPQVKSCTIAKMVHDLYSFNHPSHRISEGGTLVNMLKYRFGTSNDFVDTFIHLIEEKEKKRAGAFMALTNFVEQNHDGVLALLDNIEQTTLDLEIILCYLDVETMAEPPSWNTRHILVDEAQDDSIFEIVYTIKYALHRRCSLFLVGDASQTLYEFRAADPTALNILESSGVFEVFKLDTNYRSNQEILDFANKILGGIAANRFTNLQLHGNEIRTFDPPTPTSFDARVRMVPLRYGTQAEINQRMTEYLTTPEVKGWLDARMGQGKPVAALAYARRTVAAMEEALKTLYPKALVESIVPEKQWDTTVFSRFIALYWDELDLLPPHDPVDVIENAILGRLTSILANGQRAQKAYASVAKMIEKWKVTYASSVATWMGLLAQGLITQDELSGLIRESLVKTEIEHNSISQRLKSARNADRKKRSTGNADAYVSTIHSAKGLEFPHVLLSYLERDTVMSEEDKRMNYVALTRACESECILAFAPKDEPDILRIHREVKEALAASLANQPTPVAPTPAPITPVLVP